MYLKSIEIHGFKSFANKIRFDFHNGITGIVGPNGSGKSNVADAVRWVLGEQSAKQLRGAKMEDVIFAGTQMRKPLGFAYVAITLDNSDHKLAIEYDEVTVARRVYRSGESEYLINNSACRLRDVQELFFDTGIGKEGYSIIGQGQIERILSGKPEERRELFDEAAGIMKFKKRKYAAEKNLEAEKANLYRVTDILNEIEHQIGPLEKQSVNAKEYLRLREHLKELEVNQFLIEFEKLKQAKDELANKLDIANKDLQTSNAEYDKTKEQYEKLEEELKTFDEKLDEMKNESGELLVQKEKSEGNIQLLEEQIISIKQSDEYHKSRITVIKNEIGEKEKQKKALIEEKESLYEMIQETDLKISEKLKHVQEIRAQITLVSKQIEEQKNEIIQNLNANSEIKSNLERYETLYEQNNIQKVAIHQKMIKNRSDENSYSIVMTELKDKLSVFASSLEESKNKQVALSTRLQELNQIRRSSEEAYQKKQQSLMLGQSKLDSLVNLTERYDGYGMSIRKVMEQKSKYKGILGVVADIVKVEKNYEIAMETALGGTIQNIVTEDEKTAKDLITYLKQNKFGRATFLPLTSVKGNGSIGPEKVLQEEGVLGIASDLVHVDDKYKELIKYLLGRILVVDDMNHASNINKKYNYSLRIVTLEGELLTPGGAISGGAYKNSSNLLGRRREIEALEEEIKTLTNEVLQISNQQKDAKSENESLRLEFEEEQKNYHQMMLEQNTVKMEAERYRIKQSETENEYAQFTNELKQSEQKATELQHNISKLKETLSSAHGTNEEKENIISDLNQTLQSIREEEQKENDALSHLRMEYHSYEQKQSFFEENTNRIEEERKKLNIEQETITEEMSKASEHMIEKQDQITCAKQEIVSIEKRIEQLKTDILSYSTKKEEMNQSYKGFFEKRERLSNERNQLDKECYRIQTQLEKVTETADAQASYIWEEYELTYNNALELRKEELVNLNSMKKDVAEIKTAMKALGDVNVNAIEDYKNMSERYEFLKTQRDDLVLSEEKLLGIIAELDEEMRKQFKEQFVKIAEQFDIVFKELFGGGKASLELVPDEDILECGIIINAQPPGKKLQNMMQLSGGEKALTAISLLFAIQNLKPSPFCLLDEIEAALDDSNVNRYAKYLNKLTKDTQFIVITHRRGTMQAADRLYGITMQEKGVSTLVSVNLIENELDQ